MTVTPFSRRVEPKPAAEPPDCPGMSYANTRKPSGESTWPKTTFCAPGASVGMPKSA